MSGKTSSESKQKWENKAYVKYLVRFRYDTDKRLIDYIEKNKGEIGTTELFRNAFNEYLRK